MIKDSEIIELYWGRNESAIPQTNEKYGRYCRKISFSILSNHEDSEECVNDTYLNAWNSIPPARPQNLATYLGKICRNISINLFERLNALKRGGSQTALCLDELEEVAGLDSDVEDAFELSQLTDALNKFVGELDTDTRDIFLQRYWYMLSIKEIAKESGATESKVKMTLLRTREKLKSYLGKEGYTV